MRYRTTLLLLLLLRWLLLLLPGGGGAIMTSATTRTESYLQGHEMTCAVHILFCCFPG
jgi:hypothetical protein